MIWGKALIAGALLRFIISFCYYLLGNWGLSGYFQARFFVALIYGLLAYLVTSWGHPHKAVQAFGFGLICMIVGVFFDWLFVYPGNPDIFKSEFLWFGYLLVIILPMFNLDKSYKNPNVSSLTVG